MASAYTVSIRFLAVAGMLYSVHAAMTRPLGQEEARLWTDLIRPSFLQSVRAPDAWSGLAYAMVAERLIGVFRLSEFSLRLPSVLAGLVCAVLVWRRPTAATAAAYTGAAAIGWFSTAQGRGIATALCLLGPQFLGLAIVFSPPFVLVCAIYWRIRDIERYAIPAVVTAFVLLLIPATHAGVVSAADARPDFYRERDRRNAARGGAFQPPELVPK